MLICFYRLSINISYVVLRPLESIKNRGTIFCRGGLEVALYEIYENLLENCQIYYIRFEAYLIICFQKIVGCLVSFCLNAQKGNQFVPSIGYIQFYFSNKKLMLCCKSMLLRFQAQFSLKGTNRRVNDWK